MLMLGLRYQGGKLAEKNIVLSGREGKEKWHEERERLHCYYTKFTMPLTLENPALLK